MLEEALALSREGVAVHWLHPRQKRPIGDKWSTADVHTPKSLKATYQKGNNLGVRLGEPSERDGLFLYAIDVDIKVAEEAEEVYAFLDKLYPEWETLAEVKSGSAHKSFHLYFYSDKPLRSKMLKVSGRKVVIDGKKHNTHEVEFFGTGKQTAIPPSIHPDSGKAYKWRPGREIDFQALDAGGGPFISSEIIEAWKRREDGEEGEVSSTTDSEASSSLAAIAKERKLGISIKKARNYLYGLPDEWQDEHELWVKSGMALHHEFSGTDDEDAALRMWTTWSKQSSKYKKGDCGRRWASFGANPELAPTRFATILKYCERSAAEDDDDNTEDADEKTVAAREMNEKHAFVLNNSKAFILYEDRVEPGSIQFVRPADFKEEQANNKTMVWGPPNAKGKSKLVEKSKGAIWLTHKERRTYYGITCDPIYKGATLFNMWKGFGRTPDENAGTCELFKEHVYNNVCGQDDELYFWLMGFFAHMIQKPEQKPGVAVVMKGLKGTGKSIIGEVIGALLRKPQNVSVSQASHLVGKFNAHLAQALLVRVEEAFWSGDRASGGTLKDMITSDTVKIEYKGQDVVELPSLHRYIMTSNEEWVVPASWDERRFAVFNVGTGRKQDRPYFRRMMRELRNGGYERLMWELTQFDLSTVDVGKAPITVGLADQKLASLQNVEKWWYNVLVEGEAPFLDGMSDFDEEDTSWEESGVEVPCGDVRVAYETFIRTRRFEGDPLANAAFGKRLSAMCPMQRVRATTKGGSRPWSYRMPSLTDCRKSFADFVGQDIQWD